MPHDESTLFGASMSPEDPPCSCVVVHVVAGKVGILMPSFGSCRGLVTALVHANILARLANLVTTTSAKVRLPIKR